MYWNGYLDTGFFTLNIEYDRIWIWILTNASVYISRSTDQFVHKTPITTQWILYKTNNGPGILSLRWFCHHNGQDFNVLLAQTSQD